LGIYTEYLDKKLDFDALQAERKNQLKRISEARGGRAILTYAAAMKKTNSPIGIEFGDRNHFFDQINNLNGDKIDIILETPGGFAEIVEDLVEYTRGIFSEVGIIVPGYAKSAGTIFAMAGDEILMDPTSALGPIDAQISQNGKTFSAHAFLQGLEKIKEDVDSRGVLNRAYIPILQNISPGEIQSCQNALDFSKLLVTEWLSNYKFKFWITHSSTGVPVTKEEKEERAARIADCLCDHGYWLTHGRSLTIKDLNDMRLLITDYSKDEALSDAIHRYYLLLTMTFDTTGIYKIFETIESQLYRFEIAPGGPVPQQPVDSVIIDLECPNCKTKSKIQANFKDGVPLQKDAIAFPKDNMFICPRCKHKIDLSTFRGQIESQTKKKVI